MPASEPPVLSVAELQVDYREAEGHSVRVLAGVELALKPGEALGVLGESGCGKTTLARAILGILPPAARVVGGSIRLAGRELLGLPEAELERIRGRSIAMIFQEPGLALSPLSLVPLVPVGARAAGAAALAVAVAIAVPVAIVVLLTIVMPVPVAVAVTVAIPVAIVAVVPVPVVAAMAVIAIAVMAPVVMATVGPVAVASVGLG